MYDIGPGEILLYGLDRRRFKTTHFTINCLNSDYGEIRVNGNEIDESGNLGPANFFRADFIPFERL